MGLNKEYSNALCHQLLSLKHRHFTLSSTALQQIRTAFALFSSTDSHDFHTGVLYLCVFLHNLAYLPPLGNGVIRPIDTNIQHTLDYIAANASRSLSLTELAEFSGYSLSRFKTKFKSEIGITPAEFISMQKMEKAKELLNTTDLSITEIAFDLGFSSSNYFCAAFKRQTGISPYQYKKAHR